MKSWVAKGFALGCGLVAAAIAACTTDHQAGNAGLRNDPTPSPDSGGGRETGTVGSRCTLPAGEDFSSLSYTLTNGAHTYNGTADLGGSSAVRSTIDGVAAGTGYSIILRATSTDGNVSCTGATGTANPVSPDAGVVGGTFTVTPRATTTVDVQLVCSSVWDSGPVSVDGSHDCCATLHTFVSRPEADGVTTTLSGNASGECGNDAGVGTAAGLNCNFTLAAGSTGTLGATSSDGTGNFTATYSCGAAASNDLVNLDCTDGPLPEGGACPIVLSHGETTIACNPSEAGTTGPGETTFSSSSDWDAFTGAVTTASPATYTIGTNIGPAGYPCGGTVSPSCAPQYTNAGAQAAWIWRTDITATEIVDYQVAIFQRSFVIGSSPTGTMNIDVDDYAAVFVNGTFLGQLGSVTDYNASLAAGSAALAIPLTSALKPGTNTITVAVENGPPSFGGCTAEAGCTYAVNPGRVAFEGTLSWQ